MDKASSQDREAVVRRSRIGVALPEPSFIWPSVNDAIRRMAAEQFGLEVVAKETSYETFPEVDILEDLATDPQMLGLIVAPSIEPDVAPETWQWLTECQLPVTILERHPPQWLPGFFDSVHTDHPAGVRRGLQHFRQHGHHRVGLALGSTPTAGDIELGWQLMIREGDGLEQTFLLKDKQPYATEDVEQIVQTILETHTTAVLVHPDYLSIALVQALERRGCHIPNDLSMITIDGYTKRMTVCDPRPRIWHPPLCASRCGGYKTRTSTPSTSTWSPHSSTEDQLPIRLISRQPLLRGLRGATDILTQKPAKAGVAAITK